MLQLSIVIAINQSNVRVLITAYKFTVWLLVHPSAHVRLICTALQHHATGADSSRWCLWRITATHWVPVANSAIQLGRRTPSIPPAGLKTCGAVSSWPLIVVDVQRAELHPVWLPVRYVVVVESVTGVAMVTGHVQCVVVDLRFDGHVVVLGPHPLTSRFQLHFNS